MALVTQSLRFEVSGFGSRFHTRSARYFGAGPDVNEGSATKEQPMAYHRVTALAASQPPARAEVGRAESRQ